jgi:hypothetical protein
MNPDHKIKKTKAIVEEPTTTPRETNRSKSVSASQLCAGRIRKSGVGFK